MRSFGLNPAVLGRALGYPLGRPLGRPLGLPLASEGLLDPILDAPVLD